MTVEAADRGVRNGSAWRLAGRLSLAAIPCLAWKVTVAAAAGVLSGALVLFIASFSLLLATLLFFVGLILAAAGTDDRTNVSSGAVTITTWFIIGLMVDTTTGLLAASYLSQLATALGDTAAGGFWTDIGLQDAILFLIFSLGGGITGVTAALIFRARPQGRNAI